MIYKQQGTVACQVSKLVSNSTKTEQMHHSRSISTAISLASSSIILVVETSRSNSSLASDLH